MEQPRLLAHQGDPPAHLLEAQLAQVPPSHRDVPAVRIVEAEQQTRDRRLARAARSHDRHALARPDPEAQVDMRGIAGARIGKRHSVEGHPGVGRLGARRAVVHRERRVENGEDTPGGGEPEHSLVKQDAQLPQRSEDLDPEHQDDQQGRQRHRAVAHTPGPEGEGDRGAHRDAGIGDAARERIAAENPHRAPEELVGPLLELSGARAALAEGLERREPLHRIEEVGAEGPVVAIAREAGLTIATVPERGRQQHAERGHQQHERHRQIHEGDEREDEQRCEGGHEELRKILTEVHLELLHALPEGEHHVAGARAREVGRTERRHLSVERLSQMLLHAGGSVMRDHRAAIIERAAQDEGGRRQHDGGGERPERFTGQHATQEPAEKGEPSDAGGDGGEADEDGGGDPTADADGQRPESRVQVHAG